MSLAITVVFIAVIRDPDAVRRPAARQWRNSGGQLPPGAAGKGAQNSLAKNIL